MSGGGNNGGEFGATRRHIRDHAGEIARETVEILGIHCGVDALNLRMSDQNPERTPLPLMCSNQLPIIMNGRTGTEAANKAETTTWFADHTHDSGTLPTWSLNAWRDEIAPYQRSRFGIGGRCGTSCTKR